MDAGGLNRASFWLGVARFMLVRDVASLMKSSPHFFGLSGRRDTKDVRFTRRENIQWKSLWRLKFLRKQLGKSRTVPDKSLTDVRLRRVSVGSTATRWFATTASKLSRR